jgi:hypothetical protein
MFGYKLLAVAALVLSVVAIECEYSLKIFAVCCTS